MKDVLHLLQCTHPSVFVSFPMCVCVAGSFTFILQAGTHIRCEDGRRTCTVCHKHLLYVLSLLKVWTRRGERDCIKSWSGD